MKRAHHTVTFVWAQIAVEHADRIAAVSERLGDKARIKVIGMAGTTRTYAATPAADVIVSVSRQTLFPGMLLEDVSRWRRFVALLRATWRSRTVFMGFGYNNPDALAASWVLRALGRQIVMLSDSKFDDRRRSPAGELVKRALLSCFSGAIVAGARNLEYFRFLGYRKRPVFPGMDTISLARLRADATVGESQPQPEFAKRPFLFVGRFVEVKNLGLLLQGYAAYSAQAGSAARRLVLLGAGPLEGELRKQAAALAVDHQIDFKGFLSGRDLAREIAGSAALVLPSASEPWGLVVNEAMALGIPVIVSETCGARDVLVRNLESGIVIEGGSQHSLAKALAFVGSDEDRWTGMSKAAERRADLGDVKWFADAVELHLDPAAEPAATRNRHYRDAMRSWWGRDSF